MTGDELIDSVREVDLKIKDHRADDDFEKMLASLNQKNKKEAPKAADVKADAKAKANDSEEKKPSEPQKKPAPSGQKPVRRTADGKPVPKKRPANQNPNAPVSKGQGGAPKRRPVNKNAAKPVSEYEKTKEMPKIPEKTAEEKLLEDIEQIWKNPNLSDGGRITMRVNTDLRKEIKITVPDEVIEKRKEEERLALEEAARKDAEERKKREAEEIRKKRLAAVEAALSENEKVEDKAIAKAQKQQKKNAKKAPEAVPAMSAAIAAPAAAVPPAMPARPQQTRRMTKAERKKAEKEAAELKRTQAMTRFMAVLNSSICFLIFFGVGIYLMVCQRESGFIQSENRNLAKMPEFSISALVDGSYFEDLTKWYTDTIPGRERLKPFSNSFSKLFGIKLNDVKITGDIAPVKKEVLDEAKTKPTTQVTINTDFSNTSSTTRKKRTETEKLAEVPEELDDGEWMGNVVVAGKGEKVRAMSAFYGTFDMGEKYADTINKYREDLGSSINIYTMNMPTSAAYYMPKNLADDFTSQHDCIKNIGNNLAGIVNVDVYDALDRHKGEYIYSRTDHHWAPLGAYYAGQVFAEQARVEYPELTTYEKCQIENFVGTMYAYSNYDEELNQNPDTFIYYKPDNNYTVNYYDNYFSNGQYGASLFFDYAEGVNCYSAILGRDDIIAEIETDCNNGRVLVIMKDSFGNALVPFLTHSFSKIYVCDFRYMEVNAVDFCYDVGCTDLLFAVSLAAAHTESHINTIGNDRIQSPADLSPEEEADLPEQIIPGEDGEADVNGGEDDYNGEDEWY